MCLERKERDGGSGRRRAHEGRGPLDVVAVHGDGEELEARHRRNGDGRGEEGVLAVPDEEAREAGERHPEAWDAIQYT